MKPLVISGPSGVGKTTLNQMLLSKYKQFKLCVSLTTRNKRDKEIEGVHYYFTDQDKFNQHIQNDDFIEYQQLFNNSYGTLKRDLLLIQQSNLIPLFEIDIQGALQIHQQKLQANFLFILPKNNQQLLERLQKRQTESESQIQARLSQGLQEMNLAKQLMLYDFLTNDNLEQSFKDLKQYIDYKYNL